MSAVYYTNVAFLNNPRSKARKDIRQGTSEARQRNESDEEKKNGSGSPPESRDDGTHCCECRCRDGQANEKGMLEAYVQSATIHGLAQTSGPHHYIFRRPLWFLMILVMATSLGFTLFYQISHYYEYPIKTTTRVTLNTELPFPAVTICNLNQYIKDRVPDITVVKHVLFHFSEYVTLNMLPKNYSQVPNLDNLTDVSGKELRSILRNAAPRLSDFFRLCRWNTKVQPCEKMFKTVETMHGNCFVFNGPSHNHTHIADGAWSSLKVMVHIQNNKSYFSNHMQAGIKVIVHEPNQTPSADHDGWYMRPGLAAAVALTKFESKCLPWPYKAYSNGYCEDTQEEGYVNKLQDFPTYSASQCLSQCHLSHTREVCGCQHYFAPGDFPVCSAKRTLTCLLPLYALLKADDLKRCDCPEECESVLYEGDLSYSDFASRFIEDQATRDSLILVRDEIRDNVVDVSISFKSMNVFQVLQHPGITRSSVLGTLGGQMGLFLGASILSITELAEVILLLLLMTIKRYAFRS